MLAFLFFFFNRTILGCSFTESVMTFSSSFFFSTPSTSSVTTRDLSALAALNWASSSFSFFFISFLLSFEVRGGQHYEEYIYLYEYIP